MRLVLSVSSGNEFCDGGCEFALVDLTPELGAMALRRIDVLKEQKKSDGSLLETYYWDFHAEYFSPRTDFNGFPEEAQAAMLEAAEAVESLAVEEKELVTAPADFKVVETQIAATECEQMVVAEEGIAFVAIPKHCDFYVTTAQIPVSVLQDAAEINQSHTTQEAVS